MTYIVNTTKHFDLFWRTNFPNQSNNKAFKLFFKSADAFIYIQYDYTKQFVCYFAV